MKTLLRLLFPLRPLVDRYAEFRNQYRGQSLCP